jgi:type VI secretion system protein ImpA
MNTDHGQSNPSLEYDERFASLDAAWAEFDARRLEATDAPAAAPPDWTALAARADALLHESADLRIAIWYVRAVIRSQGLASLPAALERIMAMLEEHGRYTQPIREEGQPDDGHAIALAWLGSTDARREMMHAPLGGASDHDLHALMNESKWSAVHRESAAALQAVPWLDLGTTLARIEQRVNRGEGHHLDTRPLCDLFAQVHRLVARHPVQADPSPPVNANEPTAVAAATSTAASSDNPPLPPITRDQAMEYIDAAIAYFSITEPGHPAPILLRRARRTIGMDFHQLIDELMPDARAALGVISGP